MSRLTRLGVVYADHLRLKIVTELYMREMSPNQFFAEVGGSSLASVRMHFRRLEEYGWLRKVRTEKTDGPGRPQNVYRATELAVFDDETFAQIPRSMRDAFTAQLLFQMTERVGDALKAGIPNPCAGWTTDSVSLVLDETGWNSALEAVNGCYAALAQEQTDAKIRLERSPQQATLLTVALANFESPQRLPPAPSHRHLLPPTFPALDAELPWPVRLAKVFGEPLNLEIVRLLNDSIMSVAELDQALESPSVATIYRRCKTLCNLGWIAKVDEKSGGMRRGATEHYFRATTPAVSADEVLSPVPAAARNGELWDLFRSFIEKALEAIRGGTFNARIERHLTWSTLMVDASARRQVIHSLETCARALQAIEKEAKMRMQGEHTLGRPVTAFLASFEGPVELTATK